MGNKVINKLIKLENSNNYKLEKKKQILVKEVI